MEIEKVLNDLSYSNLVNVIQHDRAIGREILIRIVQEFELTAEREKATAKELSSLNNFLCDLKTGADHILKHLEIEKPLAIILDNEIAVFSKISMSIKRNVL